MAGSIDIAGATQFSSAGGSFSVSPPPGLAAGDIWVILLAGDGSNGNLGADPPGFTSAVGGQQGLTADNQCWNIYTRVAGASEASASVLGNLNTLAISLRVSGVTALDAVSNITTVNSASTSVSLAGSTVTTTGASRTLLWVGIGDQTSSGSGPFTWTPPTGYGSARGFVDGVWCAIGAAAGVAATAGPYTSAGASLASSISSGAAGVILAFMDTVVSGTARNGLVQVAGGLAELPSGDTFAGPVNASHAAYSGLSNDNHPQYFNTTRGDGRYAGQSHTQTVDTLTQSGATVTNFVAAWDGTQWSPQPQSGLTMLTVSMGATQQSVSTTLANITSLAMPMVANGVYQVDAELIFQTAASTTGMNAGIVAPTGARCMVEITVPLTSTAAASQLRTTFPNAATATNTGSVLGTGVTAANSNHTARVSGIVRNGSTAGFCQLQFATEVAASAVTLQIGSTMSLTRIA